MSIENAAPKPAPAETPRISEDTMGFLNTVWYDAPETASAPPMSTDSVIWGKRTVVTICSVTSSQYWGTFMICARRMSTTWPTVMSTVPRTNDHR